MTTGKRLDGQSLDNVAARIAGLKQLVPEAFREGRLDYDMLEELLGNEVLDDSRERYDFTWKGKAESLRLAQRRSNGTLRPDLEQSRDWGTTGNLYLEGDNLEVMKLLQQGYLRKVKMIYIDPPYNTGNDFVYEDDFSDPIAKYKEATGQGMRANPETAGRYHSNWLSMMYPRLKIAKTLLREDGAIFVSIDDNEQHNLRKLMDDVFGEENFVANIMWQKKYSPSNDHKTICPMHDFIVVYRRSEIWQRNLMPRTEANDKQYRYEDERGVFRPDNYKCNKTAQERPNLYYPIVNPNTGEEVWPSKDAVWRYSKERHEENVRNNLVFWGKEGKANVPSFKRYRDTLAGGGGTVPITWWPHDFAGHNDEAAKETADLIGNRVFSTPKPTRLLKRLLQLTASPEKDDIVLDFFSGSGATAETVIRLNAEDGGQRKFICIQVPELVEADSEAHRAGHRTIADIGRERIRRAGDKILSEWKKGHTDRLPLGEAANEGAAGPPDVGFRLFRLDSSNWKPWDYSFVSPDEPDLFVERMKTSLDNIKPGRRDIDFVYEVFLKYGVPLTEKLSTLDVDGKRFYAVGVTGYMLICLDKNLTSEVVEAAAKHHPAAIIFADQCFTDESEIENAGLALDKAEIEFRWI